MGIDIEVTLQGMKEIKGLFNRLRKWWRQRPSQQAMDEALRILQESARFYAPHWHEDLRDSILTSVEVLTDDTIMGSIYSNSPYAQAQERGVPAGYWMNIDNMEEWVIDRWGFGGDTDIGETDYAALGGFGLALWLYENGLNAKWFFRQAVAENEMRIIQLFNEGAEVILNSRD